MERWKEDVDSGNSAVYLSENKVEISKERFVVFLDIMGFKDRVFRNTHENIFNELSNFRNSITDILSINKDDNIEIYQFSDSIVFFSSDVTSKSFESISKLHLKR